MGLFRKTRFIGTEKVRWHFKRTPAASKLVQVRNLLTTASPRRGVVRVGVY